MITLKKVKGLECGITYVLYSEEGKRVALFLIAIREGSKNPEYPKEDYNKIYLKEVEYSMVPKLSPYISQLEANRIVKQELTLM